MWKWTLRFSSAGCWAGCRLILNSCAQPQWLPCESLAGVVSALAAKLSALPRQRWPVTIHPVRRASWTMSIYLSCRSFFALPRPFAGAGLAAKPVVARTIVGSRSCHDDLRAAIPDHLPATCHGRIGNSIAVCAPAPEYPEGSGAVRRGRAGRKIGPLEEIFSPSASNWGVGGSKGSSTPSRPWW